MKRVSQTALLGIALSLTVMIFAWFAQSAYHANSVSQLTEERNHGIDGVRSRISHLNELLEMSVSLTATGDGRWEERYRALESQLDEEIEKAIELSLESQSGKVAPRKRVSRQALAAMEQEAFDFAHQGFPEKAQAVLSGAEYQERWALFTRGLERLLSVLADDTLAVRLKSERNALLERSAAVAAICLLLVLWLTVLSRRRNEEDRLRNARTANLLASISSVLIGVGKDGRVTSWNTAAEALFGIPATEAIGRPFQECGIRWEWPMILNAASDCVEQNRPIRIGAIRFGHPNGGEGMLGATANPVTPGSVDGTSFLLLAADLTEHALLENQLLQAQKLESVGQLAAGIAHEINTPTQYVGDNTRFLKEAFGEVLGLVGKIEGITRNGGAGAGSSQVAAEIREAMDKVDLNYLRKEIPCAIQQALEGIERVTKIVRAMKEFSHPMREKTGVDINRAIESTITVARNEWKYVAEMVTELDPELPPVPCMPGIFNQVILNLIINAADAIGEAAKGESTSKGTITVSTKRDNGWVEIRVADTGVGIPEEIRGKIFDPFFTTKDVGKGSGQGLSLVHAAVVQKHGGKILVESEVGKGTTFLIRLPLKDLAPVDTEMTS